MKKVTLVSLQVRNFKGIHEFKVEFGSNTKIHGANGSGKTTIVDSFFWLLYGKNSHNQTAFNIKALDSENNPVHNLEHEVEGVFEVTEDGKTYCHNLKRVFKEKW